METHQSLYQIKVENGRGLYELREPRPSTSPIIALLANMCYNIQLTPSLSPITKVGTHDVWPRADADCPQGAPPGARPVARPTATLPGTVRRHPRSGRSDPPARHAARALQPLLGTPERRCSPGDVGGSHGALRALRRCLPRAGAQRTAQPRRRLTATHHIIHRPPGKPT